MKRIYSVNGLKSFGLNPNVVLQEFSLHLNDTIQAHLARTCFRGKVRKAGNFWNWISIQEVLNDEIVRDALLEEILTVLNDLNSRKDLGREVVETITISHTRSVGWAIVVNPEQLPNAVRIERMPDDQDTFYVLDEDAVAPMTKDVTFSLAFSKDVNGWRINILDLYPDKVHPDNPESDLDPIHVVRFNHEHAGANY